MSDVELKVLDVSGGKLVSEGFEANGFGVEYYKDDLFSEAHNILGCFLCHPKGKYDYSWDVEYEMDHEGTEYPDVFQAWTAAGGHEESLPTVAKLKQLGKWGVGFGGKKNGERAAKLALAASIALHSEMTPQVVLQFPNFGKLMSYYKNGSSDGGGYDGGEDGSCDGGGYDGGEDGTANGKGGRKNGGKHVRASPYGDADFGAGHLALAQLLGAKMGGGKGKKLAALLSGLGGKGRGGKKGPNLKDFPAENKVWVGNLPQCTTSETLEEYFSSGGNVVGAIVMKNGTGAVAYESAEEATQVIAAWNGSDMGGQAIEVDVWTSKW
jgi:hypothetical protein